MQIMKLTQVVVVLYTSSERSVYHSIYDILLSLNFFFYFLFLNGYVDIVFGTCLSPVILLDLFCNEHFLLAGLSCCHSSWQLAAPPLLKTKKKKEKNWKLDWKPKSKKIHKN